MQEKLNIYTVYRSPNSSSENNTSINDFMRNVNGDAIFVGDFNYPAIHWELMTGNGPSKEFLDAINDKHLTQHVSFATHDSGNTLDLVLSNIPNRVIDVTEYGKLGNSDHAMIETTIHGSLSLHIPRHQVWASRRQNSMK